MPLPEALPLSFPLDDLNSESAAAYARQLKLLLPPGAAFNLEPGTVTSSVLDALSQELAFIDSRGVDLIHESAPLTAAETIGDWEQALGLPDDQVRVIPGTLGERQIAVTQKYITRGGSNYAFYDDLSAACGYSLDSVDLFASLMLRAGFRVGARCYDVIWAYTMRLNLDVPSGTFLAQADFERVVRHRTHSHITAIFTYS